MRSVARLGGSRGLLGDWLRSCAFNGASLWAVLRRMRSIARLGGSSGLRVSCNRNMQLGLNALSHTAWQQQSLLRESCNRTMQLVMARRFGMLRMRSEGRLGGSRGLLRDGLQSKYAARNARRFGRHFLSALGRTAWRQQRLAM